MSSSWGQEKTNVLVQSGWRNSLLGNLVLLKSSVDWLRLTHISEAICFTQSCNWKVNVTRKHHHRHTHNEVWPNVWVPCGRVKLTQRINHPSWFVIPSLWSSKPASSNLSVPSLQPPHHLLSDTDSICDPLIKALVFTPNPSVIQDPLPISTSLIWSHLQSPFATKCNTHRLPGLGHRQSLGDHYLILFNITQQLQDNLTSRTTIITKASSHWVFLSVYYVK